MVYSTCRLTVGTIRRSVTSDMKRLRKTFTYLLIHSARALSMYLHTRLLLTRSI